MSTDWKKGIKDVFEKSKEKLDEGYDKVKEVEKKRALERAWKDAEKEEQRRREESKENRRRRQEERMRILREERFGKTMLRAKIVCMTGVAIWACWFITDFVWHYDKWIAKYHKWSIEYEAQEPARAEARIKYNKKMEITEKLEKERRIAKEKREKEEEERKDRYARTMAEKERIVADSESGKNKKPSFSQCIEHGVEYYISLGSYPTLSNGEDAKNKIKEYCSRNSNSFYYE